ncbi:hypothetical protein [Mameliella sp. RP-9]
MAQPRKVADRLGGLRRVVSAKERAGEQGGQGADHHGILHEK